MPLHETIVPALTAGMAHSITDNSVTSGWVRGSALHRHLRTITRNAASIPLNHYFSRDHKTSMYEAYYPMVQLPALTEDSTPLTFQPGYFASSFWL